MNSLAGKCPMAATRRRVQAGLCLLLMLAAPVGWASVESVQLGDVPSVKISDAFLVYKHNGAPLTLEQARAAYKDGKFASSPRGAASATNFGLRRNEVWLRLQFSTRPETPSRWFLEIGHASLDVVDSYLSQSGGDFVHQHAGDLIPFSEKPVHHRNHVFELSLAPATDYILYLRVASEGTLTAPVTFWQPDAIWQSDQRVYTVLGLYFGLFLALLIYNLFLYLSLRDPLYIIYVGFISTLAIGQAGLSGFAGQFIWPHSAVAAHLSPIGMSAAGVFGALFVQRFLGDTLRSLRIQWFMPLIGVAYGFSFLSGVLWSYHLSAISVNIISLVFSFAALIFGTVSLCRKQPGARFFVLAWAALLAGIIVISLHNLGVLPSNLLTSNALAIGSAAEMLLLSLALADRIHDIQRSRDDAQAQAIEIRQQMLESVRENERLLESRVAERTRELEDANWRLQESQQLLFYQAHHDSLTGLANRKLLSEQMSVAKQRAQRRGEGFALMVADLNQFKELNDALGHAAGDELLVEVARRLSAELREIDTVARVGGDEFVVLLESISQRRPAEQLRDRLIQVISAPVRLSCGATASVGVSIGVALYPEDATDMEVLLHLADRAMYRLKESA